MKPLRLLITTIVLFALFTSPLSALGAEPWNLSNATVANSTASGIGPITETSTTTGGGSTLLDLTIVSQSLSWQAYFGDIFQKIELSDGTNLFYDWTNENPEGEVYATRANSVDWSLVQCADYGTVIAEQDTLTGHNSDRVNKTFDSTNAQSFDVGSVSFGVGACSYATYTIDSTGSEGTFEEVLLESENNMIYTSIVSAGGAAFNSQTADFQMLVAEDGTDQVETEYYFYVELH